MSVSMTVTWAASNHPNPIYYQLQYRLVGAKTWINARLTVSPVTSAVVSGLMPGSLYEFRHITTSAPTWKEISQPTQLRAGVPPGAPTGLKVSQ
jgi:hypothetical protein